MKKIILLCLTCIFALSSAAVCFAEEGADPVETANVTIQIEGVDETVLYEEVEVHLGEEDIYLSDLLEQLDDGIRLVIAYCLNDMLDNFAVVPVTQESYKDGKMSFYTQPYLGEPAPKAGLNVALTDVASGETEEYVTDENGEIDLSETKLSGEVYVNYWQKDADGNPLALRPLKNEYTIVLPEITVDNEPDTPVAPETADSTLLLSLAAVAMFTLTVFFALGKKQSDAQ